MNQPLTILYFAWLRERTGLAQEVLPLPDGVRTVSDLVEHLSARSGGFTRRVPEPTHNTLCGKPGIR